LKVPLATYVLHETSAPSDYNTVPDSEPFTLTADEIKSFTLNDPLTAVEFPIYKINCEVDPGVVEAAAVAEGQLPEGCSLVEGVSFSVTEDGGPATTQTTGATGTFTVVATLYSTVLISEQTETATPGYAPVAGTQSIQEVANDQSGLVFVNIPQEGDLDIAKFLCTTDDGTSGTEFEVTTPRGVSGRGEGCAVGADVAFTITGGLLDEPLQLTTDADGLAGATLRVGTYTITEDSTGALTTFTVEAEETVLVVVYNLSPAPSALLVVNKLWCDLGAATGGIEIDPANPPAGCETGDATIQIDGGAPFPIGEDGTFEVTLPEGEHTISEPCADYAQTFTVVAGEPIQALIVNIQGGDCGWNGNPPTPTPGSGPTPTPGAVDVKDLPKTGSGSGSGPSGWLGMCFLAAIALGGLAFGARRRVMTKR
ncbi:MAG: LPXTG cell wall anchor domain-containing protein, partial [Thermomicrobiales bacterium]